MILQVHVTITLIEYSDLKLLKKTPKKEKKGFKYDLFLLFKYFTINVCSITNKQP